MKIRYQSRHGLVQAVVLNFVDAKDADLRTWENGKEYPIDDARMVRFKMALTPGAEIRTVKAVDAVFDLGPDWVDSTTGINPDYACAVCGRETLDLEFHNPDGTRTAYRDDAGKPVCMKDFLIAHPGALPRHIRDGMNPDLAHEITQAIKQRDAQADPSKGSTPARGAMPVSSAAPPSVDIASVSAPVTEA